VAGILRDELEGILAEPLRRALDESPGWQIESEGRALSWNEAGAIRESTSETRWTATSGNGLIADAFLRLDRAYCVATLQVTLHNESAADSLSISSLKPVCLRWSGLPRGDIRVRTLGGGTSQYYYPPDAYREHVVTYRPGIDSSGCGGDRIRIESGLDGRSSNKDLPFLQLIVGGAIKAGLIVALEWSGLWYQELGFNWAWDPLIWEAGIPVNGIRLAPGESLLLPAAHMIAFLGDADAGSNTCRRYLYGRICPHSAGRKTVPWVGYDHWFGIENVFDEKLLKKQVDRAAELGSEVFTIDSGWHAGCGPGRDHWAITLGIGNWERACPVKFPSGIESFIDYVHMRGMKFGFWFEPERAHRTSDLYKAHPEWCIAPGNSFPHLNFALREVQEFFIGIFERWIARGLDWARWDYNVGPRLYFNALDPTGKIQFAYFEGLNRVLDTVMARHPNFIFEGCASGGRRLDMNILRRSWTYWFSDYTHDPLICRFMQCGCNRFLPGHIANSALAVMTGAGDEGTTDADLLSRMCGTLFFSGDIASWSAAWTERVKALLAIYREFRHLLVEDFYPLNSQPTRLDQTEVVEFVDRSGGDAVVLGYAGPGSGPGETVRLRGLDAAATYKVIDPLSGKQSQERGQRLMARGLQIDLRSGAALRRLQALQRKGSQLCPMSSRP
jgi:alpha-galactosidase